jgi:DNA-binding transcriptional MocR family regulator
VFDATGVFRHGLRLNFTLNDETALEEAVRRLALATQRLVKP